MENNIIIFEGQDRCLKSTIINRLIQSDKDHIYHTLHYAKPPKVSNIIEYQKQTYSQMFELLSCGKNFILDRSHLGEMIWAPIYRNYDAKEFIQPMEQAWYRKFRNSCNVFLFILVDSNYDKWVLRDDCQGLNTTQSLDKHRSEIELFRNSLDLTCVEQKYMFDLQYWYKEDRPDRIDDDGLFNHIFTIVSEQ